MGFVGSNLKVAAEEAVARDGAVENVGCDGEGSVAGSVCGSSAKARAGKMVATKGRKDIEKSQ
jgi:hypothetical protein